MGLWDKEGFPHKGWRCVGMIDLGEDADDMDFNARKDELYEKCEMCNQEGVRYVHLIVILNIRTISVWVKYITIIHSKFNRRFLGVVYDSTSIWEYNHKKICD